MNPILRNVLALVFGLFIGGITNMGIIMMSSSIIPLPDGVDPQNMESLQQNMHLFEYKHFIMPFLAHALGTFVGAYIASVLAFNHKMKFAIAVGVFFLIGGIMAANMLPSPSWFVAVDLIGAYIPMGILAGMFARNGK